MIWTVEIKKTKITAGTFKNEKNLRFGFNFDNKSAQLIEKQTVNDCRMKKTRSKVIRKQMNTQVSTEIEEFLN